VGWRADLACAGADAKDLLRVARRDAQAFPEIGKLRGHIDAANEVLAQLAA